jgi:hypothetical protein
MKAAEDSRFDFRSLAGSDSSDLLQQRKTELLQEARNFELCDGGIDFARFPKSTAFHATGDNKGLTGDVASKSIRGKKDGSVSDVVRPGDLRQSHGGGDFFDHVGIPELGFVTWDDGPTWAYTVDAASAVMARVGSQAGNFVLQCSSETIGDGGFAGGIVRMTRFAENRGGRGNENGIALLLFCNDAEEFADSQKGGRQNAIESLLPLA